MCDRVEGPAGTDCERILHVARALVGGQIDLRPRCLRPLQQRHHRQSEHSGEIVGLIESSRPFAPRMERNRHDCVRIHQHIGAGRAHHRPKARRNRSPAVVLQGVDDVSKPSLVRSDCPGAVHDMAAVAAATTAMAAPDTREHGRQRISASIAHRRCERRNARPAGSADGAVERMGERRAAGCARRLEEFREGEVGGGPPASRESRFVRRCPRADRGRRSLSRAWRRRARRSRSSR